jgi:hypothetical protein
VCTTTSTQEATVGTTKPWPHANECEVRYLRPVVDNISMTDTTATTARPTRRPTTTGKPRRRRNVLTSDEPQDLSPVLAGVYIRVSTAREEMIPPPSCNSETSTGTSPA